MELAFRSAVFTWRGPAPYHFVATPDQVSAAIDDARAAVTYGWGMVPVTATVGATTWTTSLWPQQDTYYLPLKAAVRRAEDVEVGMDLDVRLDIAL